MEQKQRLEITIAPLARRALPAMASIALFGAIPTWLVYSWEGVVGEMIAVIGVAAVMVGSARMVLIGAIHGPREACLTFLGASVVRAVACPAVVILIGWATKLSLEPMIIWLAISYIACLFMECIWIVAALKRHYKKYGGKKKGKQPIQPNYMDWSI